MFPFDENTGLYEYIQRWAFQAVCRYMRTFPVKYFKMFQKFSTRLFALQMKKNLLRRYITGNMCWFVILCPAAPASPARPIIPLITAIIRKIPIQIALADEHIFPLQAMLFGFTLLFCKSTRTLMICFVSPGTH